jgi:hypothetical protein
VAWQELGGANTGGLPNNEINSAIHWLGTRDSDPLIFRTENGPLGLNNTPNPAAEVMRITPATGLDRLSRPRSVGIGTTEPKAKLHVHRSVSADPSDAGYPSIHTSGDAASLSFASQAAQDFIPDGQDGNRWLWEAHPESAGDRISNARLWSRGDRLVITGTFGQVLLPLSDGQLSPDGSGVAIDNSVEFPQVPIGTLPPNVGAPPSPPSPSELVLGGVRTSIRGFLGPPQDPAAPVPAHSIRLGKHWIRTNGNEWERWMAFVRMFRPDLNPNPRSLQAEVPWVGPGFHTPSDERMKTNVRQVEGALNKLERISGVAFEWAETELPDALGGVPGQPSLGVIAQEVEEVLPEVVSIYEPEHEYKAVDYDGLTSVLIEAVKELKAQNEALRSRIEALERV